MGARESRRTITLGRRVEALPVWAFVLLTITAAVLVLAVFFATRHHTAADGTDCGAAIFNEPQTVEYMVAGCQTVIVDAQPLAFGLGALAVALVLASAVTVIVRGWSRVEPPPWPAD